MDLKPPQTNKLHKETSNYHFIFLQVMDESQGRFPRTSSQDERDEPNTGDEPQQDPEAAGKLSVCLLMTTPSGHAVIWWLQSHLLRDS